jgi:hypothetical protein
LTSYAEIAPRLRQSLLMAFILVGIMAGLRVFS